MKKRFILDVVIPGEDESRAEEIYNELQRAFADVLIEQGVTTDGLRVQELNPEETGGAYHAEG